jgi:2-polyprenyl-6-methoxyphenol hydroxylase-like FAD-dependent oxidoreductase
MLAEHGLRVEIIDKSAGSERHGALVLQGAALEELLEERLHELDVAIHWNQRFAALRQAGGGISVDVETLAVESGGYPIASRVYVIDKVRQMRPSFVIGADGEASTVRRRMDIGVEPLGASEDYVVLDVEGLLHIDREAHVFVTDDMTSILWPLPGSRLRWTLQLDPKSYDVEARPPIAQSRVDELLAARAPWFDRSDGDVTWAAFLRFQPALAHSFGSGRTWLAGDAAHVTGALGIEALNEGLREARELTKRIVAVLRGLGRSLRARPCPSGVQAPCSRAPRRQGRDGPQHRNLCAGVATGRKKCVVGRESHSSGRRGISDTRSSPERWVGSVRSWSM